MSFLINHDYDAREVSEELLTSLASHGELIDTCVLKTGVVADEYRVSYEPDDSEWYVKFYVDGEQFVVLLSCWWYGSVH